MALDKLERQLGLLAALLHTDRPLRANEIQQRVAGYPQELVAFRRSFERDKDDLRRLGIPLLVDKTQSHDGAIDGYWVSRNDYYLHDLGLEPDEVVALSMALRVTRLEGVVADDAMWKLGGDPANADVVPAEVAAISIGPAVTQLHDAIASSATITFDYRGEQRVVEPWRLAFRRGHWYVNGYDVHRRNSRSFRLDRIDGAIDVSDARTAEAPRLGPSGERQPWQFETEDEMTYTARVAIDASHARWARHHLPEAEVVAEHEDGAIEIELEVANVGAFRSLVLSMFEAAEILSPVELRDDIVSWLEGLTA